MRTDDRANIADDDFLCATDLLDLLGYILGILQAITMGKENGVVFNYNTYEDLLADASVDAVAIGDYYSIRGERVIGA